MISQAAGKVSIRFGTKSTKRSKDIQLPLYKASRESVNWRAAGLMILTFSAIAFVAGHFSVLREHWIWNPMRTLGPTVWGVPIEEPLLYYWFPPMFTVILMHAIDNWLGRKK